MQISTWKVNITQFNSAILLNVNDSGIENEKQSHSHASHFVIVVKFNSEPLLTSMISNLT